MLRGVARWGTKEAGLKGRHVELLFCLCLNTKTLNEKICKPVNRDVKFWVLAES